MIGGAAMLVAFATGAAAGFGLKFGLALAGAACFVPLAVLNLPLALALWIGLQFIADLPTVSVAPTLATIVIGLAWLGALRGNDSPGIALSGAHRRVIGLILALTLWTTLSLSWANDVSRGSATLWQWFLAAFMFIVLVTTVATRRQLRLILGGFAFGALASASVGLASGSFNSSASAEQATTERGVRLEGGSADPNVLAAGLVPAIVICVGLAATTQRQAMRALYAGAAGVMLIGWAAAESRGGLVAAVVAVAAALAVARGGRRYVVLCLVVAAAVGTAWFSAFPSGWERLSSFQGGGNGRTEFWTVAWRMAKDHPFIGVGNNNFASEAGGYVREPGALKFVDVIAERPHVAHQTYLQILSETGVVGLALFLAVIAASLRAMWVAAQRFGRDGDSTMATVSRTVLVALASMLASSMFLTSGPDRRLWVLLAMGPVLHAIAHRSAAAVAADGAMGRAVPALRVRHQGA